MTDLRGTGGGDLLGVGDFLVPRGGDGDLLRVLGDRERERLLSSLLLLLSESNLLPLSLLRERAITHRFRTEKSKAWRLS